MFMGWSLGLNFREILYDLEAAPVDGAHSGSSQSLHISLSSPIHFSYRAVFLILRRHLIVLNAE